MTPEKRYLTSRVMDSSEEGWVSFDITSTVTDWLRYPSTFFMHKQNKHAVAMGWAVLLDGRKRKVDFSRNV